MTGVEFAGRLLCSTTDAGVGSMLWPRSKTSFCYWNDHSLPRRRPSHRHLTWEKPARQSSNMSKAAGIPPHDIAAYCGEAHQIFERELSLGIALPPYVRGNVNVVAVEDKTTVRPCVNM
ncbi:hypothetical protein H257_15610 [Aphanomyces astaci]|uniref:Uncharacterized protein n=1 Tax=Aphanomyces astaci TaxID=112090 RepID=W4FLP1_APHAT|nr:hypothetical protein H257_15610 [Aphanomyces astaci]ETV68447.1 hypothetical protein H257_15610 [Aphanomyces astaci]|eukprot:XP_009842073.1 hypothetical protein H257_15610 [Aphanomyces astaci]